MAEAKGLSRHDAMDEIQRQIDTGRRILGRPIHSFEDLARASAERSTWTLQNRKLFFHLLSDSTALASSRSGELDGEMARPSLEEAVREFQHAMIDQLACLTKVVGFLKRLA